ncbi:MAG: chorismate synthase [Candidatus Sumerlaeia bacterium]
MGSTFGRFFRVTTFGESHGGAVGCVIDGCPPRLELSVEAVAAQLMRRRPGQSRLTTQRKEPDVPEILSGVFDGRTLGTPICILVRNQDARAGDYESFKDVYRPSHADYTYDAKFGIRNWRGGGRASARETIGRVAAGAVAEQLLACDYGVEIVAWVESVQDIRAEVDPLTVTRAQVDSNIVRCPDGAAAQRMIERIEAVKAAGDSVGGVVACVARGVPPGWGEPVFDKLEADLAKAMLSLPACKGFENGSGFAGTLLRGSEHNDVFYMERAPGRGRGRRVRTRTNHSGGIQGGISNGEAIFIRAAFKPVATIFKEQPTVNSRGEDVTLKPRGRHDPCVLPRAVPMVEAMTALVLADHCLAQRAIKR